MERRLAAILAADVVGYSRLIREDEAGTLAALKAHREQLIEPKVAERKGRIVKLMGDGVLAELRSFLATFKGRSLGARERRLGSGPRPRAMREPCRGHPSSRQLARSGQARGGSPKALGSHRGVCMGPGVLPMGGCMFGC